MWFFRFLAGIIAIPLGFAQLAAGIFGIIGIVGGLFQLNSSYGVPFLAGGGASLVLYLILATVNKQLARFVDPRGKMRAHANYHFADAPMSGLPADGFPHRNEPPPFRP